MTNALTLTPPLLRVHAPVRVLDGFGRAVRAACRYIAPRTREELREALQNARNEGLTVTFRGAGRSYGDASLNRQGIVVDTSGLRQMLRWDAVSGIAETDPGLTIEDLWRRTIEDGYWPHVVPGTMAPTLAGCLSTNIHGKNHFRVGSFGESVLDFELVTPRGEELTCSREENYDVFRAAIGGMGLLGAITRIRLKLRRVESGFLRVTPHVSRNLDELFDRMEGCLPDSDYLVAWVDCLATGRSLGHGAIHAASYVQAADDIEGRASLHVERQGLPPTIAGLPRSKIWRLMKLLTNDSGIRLVNRLKYFAARFSSGEPYLQSHAAFAFLLDYVTNWRLAYGREGFLQCQVFLPKAAAREVIGALLRLMHSRGLPAYLGVLKRHRPDDFLLSHALDGWSLAMDVRVTEGTRAAVWKLLTEVTDRVLEAGGKFYFAKDAVLSAEQTRRAFEDAKLDAFSRLRTRLDPDRALASDLSRRVFGDTH